MDAGRALTKPLLATRHVPGTERFTNRLIDHMGSDPAFFLSGVRCLRMPQADRDRISNVLQQCRTEVCYASPTRVLFACPRCSLPHTEPGLCAPAGR